MLVWVQVGVCFHNYWNGVAQTFGNKQGRVSKFDAKGSVAVSQIMYANMNVRGTQYSSKRLCAKRTFVWSKKQGTGVWLRKYAVYFGFANHKAKMNIYAEGIWWTDGKEILRWEKRWQNNYAEQKYVMCQNSRLSAALLAPGGYSLSLLYGKPLGGSNIRCHFAGKWLKYILAFTGRQSTLVRRYQCYV